VVVEIERLRRRRWTAADIAQVVAISPATVARILTRMGLARLAALEPPVPRRRYEWVRPGQLVHVDIKKLAKIRGIGHRITGDRRGQARGVGWEFVHVCIDDHSRLAYAEVLPDETGVTIARFMRRAVRWFRARGVSVEWVLSACYERFVNHQSCATPMPLGRSDRVAVPG
jgi:hypothetical protein